MQARPYQVQAINEIRSRFAKGSKRVLLQAATGSGKTFIFCSILKAVHEKGTRAVVVVRGRQLVDQASERLSAMDVPHGVFMAGHYRFDPAALIQIASVDTCRARSTYPQADLLIIDEAHLATSKSFLEFLEHYDNSHWVSVTATPWSENGLEHLSTDENVIYPISIKELTEQGYLCPAKYYTPTVFDTSKIKLKSGEFDEISAIKEFDKRKVIGDVVKNYERYCQGECTFIYAINLKHAESISKSFIECGHQNIILTGSDSLESRKQILNNHNLIISVGTLITGVDVPRLKNIIMCRPTTSKNLYVQMLGRGTRTHEGKEFFRVLDHVGNINRFGMIIDERKASLQPQKKKSPKEKKLGENQIINKLKKCPKCSFLNGRIEDVCLECGHEFGHVQGPIINEDGELVEMDLSLKSRIRIRAEYLLNKAWGEGWKVGSIWFKLHDEFGEQAMRDHYYVYRNVKKTYELWSKDRQKAPCAFGLKRLLRQQFIGTYAK